MNLIDVTDRNGSNDGMPHSTRMDVVLALNGRQRVRRRGLARMELIRVMHRLDIECAQNTIPYVAIERRTDRAKVMTVDGCGVTRGMIVRLMVAAAMWRDLRRAV